MDFCLWDEIEGKVLANLEHTNESRKAYTKRLRSTALRLPASIIHACLGKMKENIDKVVSCKGKHTKLD